MTKFESFLNLLYYQGCILILLKISQPTYTKPYNMRKLFFMQKKCKTVTNSNPYLENSLHKITIIFLQNLQVLNKGVNTFPLLSLNLCKILLPNHYKRKRKHQKQQSLK